MKNEPKRSAGADAEPRAGVRSITCEALARVEGEGALDLVLRGDEVVDARLRIYEPPRYFEAFLRGRAAAEAPDLTARICGICPVAYQMSAVHAVEAALGVTVDPEVRALRRLLYCGEWIESHVLHVAMLHAPDFLGYAGAVEMAADHRDTVALALALKKAGNALVACLGGREIHPINVRIGGFYRVPTRAELRAHLEPLRAALEMARAMTRWVAGFDFPELEVDYEFLSLRHADEYPFNEGRMVSSGGLDFPVQDWNKHLVESHVQHSNALHSRLRATGQTYLVGPLARYALCRDQLAPEALALVEEVALEPVVRNPYRSIIVRGVETAHAIAEAIRIIEAYRPPARPAAPTPTWAGQGHAATEAPRGTLFHRYVIDEGGLIREAQLVPPTAQNLPRIEDDIRQVVPSVVHLDDDALQERCEMTIRNHDPCISCATHFLDLRVVRL